MRATQGERGTMRGIPNTSIREVVMLAVLAATVLVAGCGRDGQGRHELSGRVTYKGQPVPGGRILFVPDGSQANTGPGSVADIQDGRYRTRRGLGAVGGPHHVVIYGTDGTAATEDRDNALFPTYRIAVELSPDSQRLDFAVPEQGDGKEY